MSPSRGLQACTTPGCDELVTRGKCAACRGDVETARGTPAERGYDAAHRALRKRWAPLVAAGHVTCWRCGLLITPGQLWDLGHDDDDRSVTRGPEHRGPNRAAGARRGNRSRAR